MEPQEFCEKLEDLCNNYIIPSCYVNQIEGQLVNIRIPNLDFDITHLVPEYTYEQLFICSDDIILKVHKTICLKYFDYNHLVKILTR